MTDDLGISNKSTELNNSTTITVQGADGKSFTVVIASLLSIALTVGLAAGVVGTTAIFLTLSWYRESDRQYTQSELVKLQIQEMGQLLIRENIKKPGDDWLGPILNQTKEKE